MIEIIIMMNVMRVMESLKSAAKIVAIKPTKMEEIVSIVLSCSIFVCNHAETPCSYHTRCFCSLIEDFCLAGSSLFGTSLLFTSSKQNFILFFIAIKLFLRIRCVNRIQLAKSFNASFCAYSLFWGQFLKIWVDYSEAYKTFKFIFVHIRIPFLEKLIFRKKLSGHYSHTISSSALLRTSTRFSTFTRCTSQPRRLHC